MVTFTAADDRRQSYAANQARRAVNAARQHKATFGDPNWIMSQSPETMQDRDFMSQAKPAMVAMQGNKDFLTTDKDEKRNLYQMWMNQMKGGDRGARMMDLRGLPSVVQSDPNRYRRGRTMFQDPSKSQGFLGDVGSLFSGNNRAAVYADEYNPFPKAGFGEDWYKDKFKFASGLGSLMEGAENFIPGATWAKQFLPKSKRLPLERDLSWVPEGVGEYDKIPEIPFVEDVVGETPLEAVDRTDDWWYTPPFFDEDITVTDLPPETFEEPTNEIFNEEVFNKVYELIHPTGQTAAEIPEHFDQFESPWDMFLKLKESMEEGEWTDQELLDRLIEEGYLKDTTGGEDLISDINLTEDDFEGVAFDVDKNLEDQAESLNEIERLKNIQRDNNWLFDI